MVYLKNNQTKMRKHIYYVLALVGTVLFVTWLFPNFTVYVPLILIFTLLIYQNDELASKQQMRLMNKSLLYALLPALLVAKVLHLFPLTLPVVFLIYMIFCKQTRFKDNYVFSGILLLHAYFGGEQPLYYIVIVVSSIIFSIFALFYAKIFSYSVHDEFNHQAREVMLNFKKVIIATFHHEYLNVSVFFEALRELRYQFSLLVEEEEISQVQMLQLDQLLYEIEEGYFYLRNLTDAPIALDEMLLESYWQAGVPLEREKMILGSSPYQFHAKNLLRHYRQAMHLIEILAEGGLQL